MRVRLEKPTAIPDRMYDGSLQGATHPIAWAGPGEFDLFEIEHEGERVFVLPDTSLGAGLEWWRSIDGYSRWLRVSQPHDSGEIGEEK